MAKNCYSVARVGGNISRELIYKKGKWCKADNERINNNKLLEIGITISKNGNEDEACKHE